MRLELNTIPQSVVGADYNSLAAPSQSVTERLAYACHCPSVDEILREMADPPPCSS